MKLINIGYGNMVSAERIVTIVSPESAPIKRLVQEARDDGRAIDATYGRKTRAVLVMDSGHIILSSLITETLAARINGSGGSEENE
ncbi:MAG: DUF370 domain-containing protein [Ruminococcus sp.]|uniref:DUF370 domain-containing protein n=1 Tax=Ruminococcus sp. TaxID=41978 RepID=UPI001B5FE2CA|nr:DUF370 domain-containing protein [Ruminococcus sp.]MBO4493078.1 DUF370 domain-containing protein [Ruminococcus sp.]MBP5430863.1 DUF370 domain-containing protein [Ruminococcus sp.]